MIVTLKRAGGESRNEKGENGASGASNKRPRTHTGLITNEKGQGNDAIFQIGRSKLQFSIPRSGTRGVRTDRRPAPRAEESGNQNTKRKEKTHLSVRFIIER